MRTAVYSARSYDRRSLTEANRAAGEPHVLDFLDDLGDREARMSSTPQLTPRSATFATDHDAVCVFTNDDLGRETLAALREHDCRAIALRCAGFNRLDIEAAREMDFLVARVPAYSPHAVAEHAVGLLLAVVRRIHRAHARVREQNFSLEGLLGVDLHGKTVTIVGTGAIGSVLARIMLGFGCRVLAVDPVESEALKAEGVQYRPLHEALPESRVLMLNCPLRPETHHLIDDDALALLPDGAFLVNTARGAIIDTRALIGSLKAGRLGGVALDVYEEEEDLFFEDRSQSIITDDVFARLTTFPNVLITSHQGFFTREAMEEIARTTIANLSAMEQGAVPDANGIPGL